MKLYFEQEQEVPEDILATMEKAADYCLELDHIDRERSTTSVSFVSEEEIKELNGQYRGVDKVTDVLSFPQFEDISDLPEVGELCLGDVVICKKRAEEQALELGHSFRREIIYLFVHSICHLLGFDHMEEDEKALMRAREEEVMDYLGILRDED